MRFLLAILFLPLVLSAQVVFAPWTQNSTAPANQVTLTPTNFPGLPSAAFWYEPAIGLPTTNSGVQTVPNLTAYGNYYNATNEDATTTWVNVLTASSPNSTYPVLNFSLKSSYLKCVNYTNSSNVQTIVMFGSVTNSGSADDSILDSLSGTACRMFTSSGNTWNMRGVFTVNVNTDPLQKWEVLIFAPNNDGSPADTIYTNGVAGVAGNMAGGSMNGMYINGEQATPTDGAAWKLATMFGFTNQTASAALVSNSVYYCTNKFGKWQ